MVNIRLKILDKGNIIQEQLIRVLQKHEDAIASESGTDATLTQKVGALETTVGGENSGLVKSVTTLETTVGGENSGLVKNVATLETAVGDADSGLVKSVNGIETAIGDESTEGTILARIKALENKVNTDSQEPSG